MNTSNGSENVEQFIRYLYEYESDRPIRNVGFVKVETADDCTTIHIHGKGLRLGEETALKLYLFYPEEQVPVCVYQGEVTNVNPTINYRLVYTSEDTGVPEHYSEIDGILLMSESGRRYAAVWSDALLRISELRIWQEVPIPATITEEILQKVVQDQGETVEPEQTAGQEEKQDVELSPEEEEIDHYIEPTKPQIRKIQRQEIAMLPRCEWRVANNSFLLHGYYNYHYLILLEEENQMWLGVPGIYHRKEAKAAEVFGFTRFVQAEQDESEENEMFGYWCRKVRHMRSK